MTRNIILTILLSSFYFSALAHTFDEQYVDNTLTTDEKPTGTATGGGNDYICLEAGSSASDDTYNNYGIMMTGGTGTAGESKRIIDYDASGGVCECYAQVDSAWTVNPDATTTYEITIGSDANNCEAPGLYDGVDGACRQISHCFDQIDAEGERCNVLAGREYDQISIIGTYGAGGPTNGTKDNPNAIEGYTSSPGDGGIAVIDAQSTLANNVNGLGDNCILRNLEFKGATDDAIDNGTSGDDYNTFIHLKVSSAGGSAIDSGTGTISMIFDCDLTATGTIIYGLTTIYDVVYNYIHDNTSGVGINVCSMLIAYNIVEGINTDGIQPNDDTLVMFNTVDTCGDDGIGDGSNRESTTIINNIITNCTGHGIQFTTSSTPLITGYNCLYNNTGGTEDTDVIYDIGGNQTGDPDFVGAGDWNLDSSTTIDDTAFPATTGWYGASSTTGSNEMGVAPYEETGGGGTAGGIGATWLIQ